MNDENGTLMNVILRTVFAGSLLGVRDRETSFAPEYSLFSEAEFKELKADTGHKRCSE